MQVLLLQRWLMNGEGAQCRKKKKGFGGAGRQNREVDIRGIEWMDGWTDDWLAWHGWHGFPDVWVLDAGMPYRKNWKESQVSWRKRQVSRQLIE
jgi:hypothetical protein